MKEGILKYLIALFLILNVPHAVCSLDNVRFKRLTINDGLSLSTVYCTFQDSKGFIWFGTEDGLNRYDGKNFTVYRADSENPNSISYKWIELIYEDSHGILWFGSRGGLTRFDPNKELFQQYKTNIEKPYQLRNDTIRSICQISKDELLIGTMQGVEVIHLKNMECTPLNNELFPDRISAISIVDLNKEYFVIASTEGVYVIDKLEMHVRKITLNKAKQVTVLFKNETGLWIGTNNGVYSCDIESLIKSSHEVQINKLESSEGVSVENLFIDNSLNIWISSQAGLYKSEASGRLNLLIPSQKQTRSLALVSQARIIQDEDKNIWYATHGDGAFKILSNSGEIVNYVNNPCNSESLSENALNCILEDNTGAIWFGTFGAGVCAFSPGLHKFGLITKEPTSTETLASNFVWTVQEDSKGRLWIGSNDKGITRIDPSNGNYTYFDFDPHNSNSISNTSVRKIYEDSEGVIWIGTDGGGLNKYIESTDRFISYQSDPQDPATISDNSVRAIYDDKLGNLWVGTRNGLNRFNKANNTFTRYLNEPDNIQSISHNFVYASILRDSNNILWVGTYGGGLNRLDIHTGIFEHYTYDPNNVNSISDNIIFSIYEDKYGMLWLGTNAKLNKFNPLTGEFKHYGLAQGLPNEVVYSVVPDEDGNLWLSTNLGICRFDPINETVLNFDVNDGLQSNEFNGGAFHLGYSGKIYFGGVYGLNTIDPKAMKVQEDIGNIVFTNLEILGKDVKVSPIDMGDGVWADSIDYYMSTNISYIEKLILEYKHRHFSLEFIDLGNMLNTELNYAFKMEGLDAEWKNTGKRNYVSYANLSPGNYTFKVRSRLSDGSWSKNIASLIIDIKPPFWRTWWFVLIESILVSLLFLAIYRYLLKLRTYRLLQIQNERINKANHQLKVSEQNLQLLNATKDKFFSIISHDLKNPFTSLLSISEILKDNIETFDEEERKSSVKRVHSSLKEIYNLLENLLTWSRTQTNRIQFNPVEFNLSKLIQENYNLYKIASCKKNIELNVDFDDDITVFADRDMINAVIRNLLNNAVKFTPSGKSIEMGVNKHDTNIEVYIKDEGIGISVENINKLFKIDQKVKLPGTDGEKGTGLGLIICKEFIEKNKGHIKVKSEENIGSKFSFILPTTISTEQK